MTQRLCERNVKSLIPCLITLILVSASAELPMQGPIVVSMAETIRYSHFALSFFITRCTLGDGHS